MKKWLLLVVLAVAGLSALERGVPTGPAAEPSGVSNAALMQAIAGKRSDTQVRGQGRVSRLLADDLKGSRHQRFILTLPAGGTLLIAHNIDLAPRIDSLREGDEVEFYGEYEWNDRGGVVHWTHHDPRGNHVGGWLRHKGRTYE
ncbi:DUF3465 domain-containing protein [Marinobacterium rhizophilum]|uniref:DUF3465 domain-containing protein n=1 Tax=Marinobacterium rhizophilum TaxID=420402 RepID=A0ABY5HIT2_9GAMM|nr:DUF3465 domain-containing protein [Marinobacterium rhizophilum]UTW11192.1 DUF3465 domain-containing protein [Marinobacterium rhizophilum]